MQRKTSDNSDSQSPVSLLSKESSLHIEFETPRLFIRSYSENDLENSIALYGDSEVTKYFDHGAPRSRQEVLSLIEERGFKYFKNGQPFGLFSIFQKEDMSFIGHIDLMPTDEPGVIEIGYILNLKHQNKGFCSEAVKAFLFDYVKELIIRGFTNEGLLIHTVKATVHPNNLSSKKILEKVGMQFETSQKRFGHPRLTYLLNNLI